MAVPPGNAVITSARPVVRYPRNNAARERIRARFIVFLREGLRHTEQSDCRSMNGLRSEYRASKTQQKVGVWRWHRCASRRGAPPGGDFLAFLPKFLASQGPSWLII